jgi:hypothetical protein
MSLTKVIFLYFPICCVSTLLLMVSPCGVWWILTFPHFLVFLLIWLCCPISYYHLFFSSITSLNVFSSAFLCHHLLFHYLKLKPWLLKREATWVAYSTLISHIHAHVVTRSQVAGWNPLEGFTKSSCGKLRLEGTLPASNSRKG